MAFFTDKPRSRQANPRYRKQSNFSYRSLRREESRTFQRGESPKIRLSKGVLLRRVVGAVLLIAILVLAGWASLVGDNASLKVTNQKINQKEISKYQQSINSNIHTSFRNKFKFSFDQKGFESAIKSQNPEVQSVIVTFSFFSHNPIVQITPAEVVAYLVSGDKIYALDHLGKAIYPVSSDTNQAVGEKPVITDPSQTTINIGERALASSQMEYILEIVGQADKKGIEPSSIELSDGGYGINIKFDKEKYFVKFSFYTNARQSVGEYFAVKDQLQKAGNMPSRYVDVRVPQKVYVR